MINKVLFIFINYTESKQGICSLSNGYLVDVVKLDRSGQGQYGISHITFN